MAKKKIKLKQEPISESTQESNAMEIKENTQTPVLHKTIHSHDLLHNGKEILILHKGEQYLLRCTRNNKLILTK